MDNTVEKNGMVRLNLAEEDGLRAVTEHFGGEEYLRQKFPRILDMIHNTGKHHRRLFAEAKAGAASGEAGAAGAVTAGFQDGMSCALYDGIPQEGAVGDRYALSEVNLTQTMAMILLDTTVYKIEDGQKIAVSSGTAEEADSGAICYNLDTSGTKLAGNEVTLQAESTAHCIKTGPDGPFLYGTFQAQDLVHEKLAGEAVVSGVEAHDPMPKVARNRYIEVSYGRAHLECTFDYDYPDARYIETAGGKYVTAYLQFKVTVTLNPLFRYAGNPFDEQSFRAFLSSGVVGNLGGTVPFDSSTIKNTIKTEVNGNVMTLSLKEPYFWNTTFPLASLRAIGGVFDFHLQFRVNYTVPLFPGTFQATVIASTRSDVRPSKSVAKIPKQLNITWGCLGGDTVVKTRDGDKKIADVAIGDSVLAEGGEYVKVVDIAVGEEPSMVLVNALSEEHAPLLLTAKHLIKTRRGVVSAEELNAADDLAIADGKFAGIIDLETVPYTGKVYNLTLEKPVCHFANDFLAASSAVVADPGVKDEGPVPLDPELVRELREWSAARNAAGAA